mgnify:CR=1 FL=1
MYLTQLVLQGGGVFDLERNDDDLADPDEWENASTSDEDVPLDEENPLLLLTAGEGGETTESDVGEEEGEEGEQGEEVRKAKSLLLRQRWLSTLWRVVL